MNRNDFVREAKKREGRSGQYLFDKYGIKTHWCMMQVYDLMHDTAKITQFPKTYSCSEFKNTDFAKSRINHDYKTGEVGDIILFENNGSRADGPDHVGIVIENTGRSLKILEGNTAGHSYLYYDTSTTNIYEYSYGAGGFDCIIDMSDFFSDEIEEEQPPDETEKTATFTCELRTLKKGMKGSDVKSLQRLLCSDGYDVGPCGDDGDFGNATERAVIRFQEDHMQELEADGVVGFKTFTKLWKG